MIDLRYQKDKMKKEIKTKSTPNPSFDERRGKQNLSVSINWDTCLTAGRSPFKKGRSQKTLDEKIEKILEILRKRHWTMGVMESCTGGAMTNVITNIPGASDVFDEGKVTYSVESKIRAGVRKEIIEEFGVYSAETAGEMACVSRGEVGVGITGNLPGEVFVAVRIENKIESRMLKLESRNKNEIEARKEMKREVVNKVMEIICAGLV